MPEPLIITATIGAISAAVTIATTLVTRTAPWLYTKYTSKKVTRRLGTILTKGQVEHAVRYYVEPMCQNVDPAGAEEPRLAISVRQKLFTTLDETLTHPTEYKYIFLLADSGMGKSSALINYYARNLRRLRTDLEIELIPLGIPNADERIAAITEKPSKILFLDAFDEDILAIVDHAERLRNLLKATQDFRRVVITCRTQFFGKDQEIPSRTGFIKVGVRGPGESAEYLFHKIYLSPFGDKEIKSYINKRYPAWRRHLRKQAFRMIERIPNLVVRPMLLTHIDDLVKEKYEVQTSFELYKEMVEAWIQREEGFVGSADLRKFSEHLAVDIYVNRSQRGAERVPREEIERLALDWNIQIDSWHLTGRSLLNRDAEGSYKFAHRSIMEYLFVKAFLNGDKRCISVPWTDQMRSFLVDLAAPESDPDSIFKTEILHNRHLLESMLSKQGGEGDIARFVSSFLAQPLNVALLLHGRYILACVSESGHAELLDSTRSFTKNSLLARDKLIINSAFETFDIVFFPGGRATVQLSQAVESGVVADLKKIFDTISFWEG